MKAGTAMALAIATLAVLTAGCGSTPARDRTVIVVAVRTPPNNFDPRQGNDETSQRVGQLVFSSLMDVGPDLRVVPRLAIRLDNPDPLTYVAHLRRGVQFHDGHELTAKDVVYTYASFLDPSYISPFKGAFRVLQSVRALDDYGGVPAEQPFGAFHARLAGVPPRAGRFRDVDALPRRHRPSFVSAEDDLVTLSAFEGYFDGLPSTPASC